MSEQTTEDANKANIVRIRELLGEGMKKGTVSYAPKVGKDGVFGSLHSMVKDNLGQMVRVEKLVTDQEEAAQLLGLQQQIDKQREG
jgi:hypothetical protein